MHVAININIIWHGTSIVHVIFHFLIWSHTYVCFYPFVSLLFDGMKKKTNKPFEMECEYGANKMWGLSDIFNDDDLMTWIP